MKLPEILHGGSKITQQNYKIHNTMHVRRAVSLAFNNSVTHLKTEIPQISTYNSTTQRRSFSYIIATLNIFAKHSFILGSLTSYTLYS
jgi:hypothetical protein